MRERKLEKLAGLLALALGSITGELAWGGSSAGCRWRKDEEVSMGKFAEAVRSHRKHLRCAREADDPRERARAANELHKDLDHMLASIDERFDAEDKLEWEWVSEKEAL